MPAKAPDHLRARICKFCGVTFRDKPSRVRVFCSIKCRSTARRTRPTCEPRPCAVCSTVFSPSRAHGDAKYCSKRCIWIATKGPEFNARIARENRHRNREVQVDKSNNGRTYRKFYGRHEHRVVAERMLGRPLAPGEIVHHKDGDKRNNDPLNLEVMTQREHMRAHGLGIPGVKPWWKPWEKRWPKQQDNS